MSDDSKNRETDQDLLDQGLQHEDDQPDGMESDAVEAEDEKEEAEFHNKEIGRRGENAAVRYLERFDYEILERNWTCPAGEVDIIARDSGTLVFCEVKTRTNLERGLPSEAVDAEKRSRYEKIAAWFLRDYEFVDIPVRFDIIALLVVAKDRALIRHYCNAFSEGC